MARQFASLEHPSGGRAAWNVITSWDAFTGENFQRGGFLAEGQRYERAKAFLQTTQELLSGGARRAEDVIAHLDQADEQRCAGTGYEGN